MSSIFSKYQLFEKKAFTPEAFPGEVGGYDRLLSTYNSSCRVGQVFKDIVASEKHWLIMPQYGLEDADLPDGDQLFKSIAKREGDYVLDYLDSFPIRKGEKICVDITGFLRPHLLFLLRYLYELGLDRVDMIYSEPESYVGGSKTRFSLSNIVTEQVDGYHGCHNSESEGEYIVVGCGYDTRMMKSLVRSRPQAMKVQVFPFPSLRPHMYQENRLKTEECQVSFGRVLKELFAPGYDPFSTAGVLSAFYEEHCSKIRNLYLAPLATKPQVLGFGLFYLLECLDRPVSMLFPYSEGYNLETSVGISEIWRYSVDFDLLRSLQS